MTVRIVLRDSRVVIMGAAHIGVQARQMAATIGGLSVPQPERLSGCVILVTRYERAALTLPQHATQPIFYLFYPVDARSREKRRQRS